jgi:hypothetical protein
MSEEKLSGLGLIRKNKPGKPRIVIHGLSGVGKTTFFANAKNPIFIQAENGLGYLDVEVDAFPENPSFDDMLGYLDTLINEDHQYKTLVIDSIDWMENAIYDKLLEQNPGKSLATIEGGYGKGYIKAYEMFNLVLKKLDALSRKGMVIGLICHSKIKKIEDPRADHPYDTYDLALQSNNNADIRAKVLEWCDYCGFATQKTVFSSKGENKVKATQTNNRELCFKKDAAYTSKARTDMGDKVDLDWSAFVTKFKQSLPRGE